MVWMRWSHRLVYLKTQSPGSRTLWKGLGGVLLSEVCHWGWALRFQKTCTIPCLLLVDWDVSFGMLLQSPAICYPCSTIKYSNLQKLWAPNKLSSGALSQQQKRNQFKSYIGQSHVPCLHALITSHSALVGWLTPLISAPRSKDRQASTSLRTA